MRRLLIQSPNKIKRFDLLQISGRNITSFTLQVGLALPNDGFAAWRVRPYYAHACACSCLAVSESSPIDRWRLTHTHTHTDE